MSSKIKLIIVIISIIIANSIGVVFSCTIDTIYICAFKDMAQPGGVKFMQNEMREGFGLNKTDEAKPIHSTFNPDGSKKERGTTTQTDVKLAAP